MVAAGKALIGEQALCHVSELADGSARGFLKVGGTDSVFAVRRNHNVYVYRNVCPHNDLPLDYMQDQFLSKDGCHIICYAHGAHFSIETGVCISGVCLGDSLTQLPSRIVDGRILISMPVSNTITDT